MADRLYLSYWLRGHSADTMLKQFEKVLSRFPFSQLTRVEAVLRIYAISYSEAPILETLFPGTPDPARIVAAAGEFGHVDSAFQLDCFWDLWGQEAEWQLRPARVLIECFGPEFEQVERGENLRIDFGSESQFLPGERDPGMKMVRANVQSLLRLVHDMDDILPIENRLLWSESGENFAEKLEASLRGSH